SCPNPSFLAFLARRPSSTPGIKPLPERPSGADKLPIWDPTTMARSQELARLFQQPHGPAQRRYEICRAYFYDGSTADQLAARVQLQGDAGGAMLRDFARDPDIDSFFATGGPGRKTAPKRAAIHERACALRRQGDTLDAVRDTLLQEGCDISKS